MRKRKIFIPKEKLALIADFHHSLSVESIQDKEIGSFWAKGQREIKLNFNTSRSFAEITTERHFAHSLFNDPLSNIIEKINVTNSYKLIKKLSLIKENDPFLDRLLSLSIPKNPEFGVKHRGKLLTQRFVKGLVSSYIFFLTAKIHNISFHQKPAILEIGAGIGNMGIIFKILFPESTYIIIDLPVTLITAMLHISAVFPDSRILVVKDTPISERDMIKHDFIFIPHYAKDILPKRCLDIVWNESSMGEMESKTVSEYFNLIRNAVKEKNLFYNSNRLNKNSRFFDYPYTDKDIHILKSYDIFHHLADQILYKKWKKLTSNYHRYLILTYITKIASHTAA